MNIAIVGTGYVCDMYLVSLAANPDLRLIGVYDHDEARARIIAESEQVKQYQSLDDLVADPKVDVVVNLTNPASHYEVSRAAIEAGKHVYSEKPLAMDLDDARHLVELAEQHRVVLSGAPCSVLGEAAQTLQRELQSGRVGTPRVVYAELDDGPVSFLPIQTWKSTSGFGWPYEDEFRVGCTMEHAGYYLTWLTTFFGPVKRMTSFSSVLLPEKPGISSDEGAPDFSVGCLEFEDGTVARITNGLLAPRNHTLLIVGDDGMLSIEDCWDYRTPVRFKKHALRPRIAKIPPLAKLLGFGPTKVPLVDAPSEATADLELMDYCRGISSMIPAITRDEPLLLSAAHLLHLTEITLTLQHPAKFGSPRVMETTFERIS